ncbi:MAG: nicotinate phosphoribosyltransferase [Spirulina sp. DLM2.Bin59]|nr:MAG: nicotinate phosphoribosyltransferase [Spirulina sp. DLM2.Bin59]
MLRDAGQFVSEAIVRLFAPSDASYPEIGVQPFSGELRRKTVKATW